MSCFSKLFWRQSGLLLVVLSIVVLVPVELSSYRKRVSGNGLIPAEDQVDINYLSQPMREPNSKKRQEIIDRLFYPVIAEVLSSPGYEMEPEKWPLPEKSCLYVVRRGRVRQRIGFDPTAFLPPEWETNFFPALYNGGPLFENKVGYFYPRYISYENFLQFEDSFNPVTINGERFIFYFVRDDSNILFFLLHSSALSNEELSQIVSAKYIVSDNNDFLWPGRFLAFLLFFPAFLLGIYQNRSSFRYRMLWLGGMLFLVSDLFFVQWFADYMVSKKQAIDWGVYEDFNREFGKLEEGLSDFLQSEANRVLDFYQRDPELEADFWPEGLMLFRAGMKGMEKTRIPDSEILTLYMAERAAPKILTSHPFFPGSVNLTMEEFIESFMSEESRLWQNMLGMRPGVEVDRMFFSVELSSIFRLYRVVNRGYYWLWYYDGLESEPRIFLALYDQSELLFRYLQQTFSSYEKKNQNLFHFISREKGGKARFLATENAGEIFEMRRAAFRELSRGHLQMSQFVQDKQKWLSFFAESPLLGSYVMGFVSPEELYAPLAKIQKVFFGVQVFFLALMILSFILLSRLLLLPLAFLQKGLRSLLDGRYDSAVPVKMSDERGVCLNSFNFMNSELKQREKLMPFVAGQVLRLFSADDGSLRDFIQDEACVVFSDIRSFTTISEQQEPEKIVEMLNDYFTIWQSVVEKYDGIIERFIGDAIVVIFFRRFSERYAQDAVNSACEVMQALTDFNHQRDLSGLFTIKNGIGVACGEIGFGILGDEKRRHFFAMGEAVKKAEELEAATKKGRFTHIFADSIVAEKLTELDFDFVRVTDLPDNLLADKVFELSS